MIIKSHTNEIFAEWNKINSNWLIQLVHKFVLITILCSLVVIILKWGKLPPLVPLWYSRPWGTDQFAQPIWLFILPLGSLLLYFINLIVGIYLSSEYLIFTQILFLSSFIVSFLSFVTLLKIIFLVT